MFRDRPLRSAGTGRIPGGSGLVASVVGLCLVAVLGGCAGSSDADIAARSVRGIDPRLTADQEASYSNRQSDLQPVALQFVTVHENERSAPYYPFEGLSGLAFGDDGTLYICDELGGRIHGWDQSRNEWFQFNVPGGRYARPVDVRVDGFLVLVLDMDGHVLQRYDLDGVFLDRLVDFRYLDPGYDRLPTSFDVDVDGGLVVCDGQEDQILILDSFLNLRPTVGGTGSFQGQFRDPSGVVFLRDGTFVVADRGNRRLQHFNRLGAFLEEVGGEFAIDNPLLTPQGLARDEYGNLFVADPASGKVHVYDAGFEHLFSVGSELGLLASPEGPIDVAVSEDGLLAVSDRSRQAVLLYRILYR